MLIHPHSNSFLEVNKNGNFLTWPGLNNQHMLKHLRPSIATALGHLIQEIKTYNQLNK